MTRKVDITFDSEKDTKKKLYQLASGYISETTILFEKEKVVALIQAKGSVEFYNMDDEMIAAGKVPPVDNGKGVYEDIGCQAGDHTIELQFPIYEWIDHYPNCDGEHDRWDTKVVGFHTLTLDLTTGFILSHDIGN